MVGGGGGMQLQKNPEYVIKSKLKDKMLNNCPKEFVHDCSGVDHVVSTAQ